MVKMGPPMIRRVPFVPPSPDVVGIEANTLAGIRERGGPHEFLTSQRLDFDLLVRIDEGTAQHTVDFAGYMLRPGDVLWVRAGQVHRWGSIDDIEGPVVLFGPHSVDDRSHDLIRSHAVRLRNHWSAADLHGSPVSAALDLLTSAAASATEESLRQASLVHCLAVLLMQLALVEPSGGAPSEHPTHEAFGWFRDHIDDHFHEWHKVTEYADRLGYSTRTLNRLARQNTGLSAKELIDERVVLEAKRQLSHADATVAEIAESLGFDDPSNFVSYFRRHERMTPGAFRGQSRGATRPMSAS